MAIIPAAVTELADVHDSKSCEVTPHGSSTLPFGIVEYHQAAVVELVDTYASGAYA